MSSHLPGRYSPHWVGCRACRPSRRKLPIPITYSLTRYLAAKKSVDDRALNWQVWQHLVAALPRATPQQPLRVLEVGAGIGAMVERLVAGYALTHATYTAIDQAPALLAEAYPLPVGSR